jgi:poly(A) polymerase
MNRVPASGHFDFSRLDPDALKVVRRLRQHGHEAYLVGGSVRDLWLSRTPKDFDIATNATPRQIKRVFSNSRLIGRRFRLAHVFFGPKILEVSTFRSNVIAHQPDDTVGDEGEERDLLVRDDNIFGTAEEDAVRRDFTINGLFYDPDTQELIDYVHGIPDLEEGLIRTIGDADIRVQEDPVRILRAIKFAARLGFHIHDETWAAMLSFKEQLLRCSPARVHEEVMRLLSGGAAEASVKLMWESGVLDVLLPDLTEHLNMNRTGSLVSDPLWKYLAALDAVDRTRRPISPGLLIGTAFWPILEERINAPEVAALDYGLRIDRAVDSVTRNLRLPKRENALLKQVLIARRRLRAEEGQKKRRGSLARMLGKAYFPAAVAFAEIEMRAGGATSEEIAAWEASLGATQASLAQPQPGGPGEPGEPGESGAPGAPGDPRKRRRRRRRRRPQEGGGSNDESGGRPPLA